MLRLDAGGVCAAQKQQRLDVARARGLEQGGGGEIRAAECEKAFLPGFDDDCFGVEGLGVLFIRVTAQVDFRRAVFDGWVSEPKGLRLVMPFCVKILILLGRRFSCRSSRMCGVESKYRDRR